MEKENIINRNFIMTNRDIIAKFGVNSAVMLGELYGRMNLIILFIIKWMNW